MFYNTLKNTFAMSFGSIKYGESKKMVPSLVIESPSLELYSAVDCTRVKKSGVIFKTSRALGRTEYY